MEGFKELVLHRRIKLLQEEIEEGRKELLELIEKWYYLRYVVQPKLEFEYEKVFGELEDELEEKASLCNKMERKIELFFVKINRGVRVNRNLWNFIEKSVDSVKKSSENNLEINPNDNNYQYNFKGEDNQQNSLNSELTRMYRFLVKQLHPDVSGETEFFKKFWVPIQDAYKERNFSKIRVFYKILNKDIGNFDFEEDKVKKLEEELKELRLMIGIEKRVIERMLQQEPFIFEKNLKNPHWIEEHRKKLKEKISFLDKQIEFNKRLLDKIQDSLED